MMRTGEFVVQWNSADGDASTYEFLSEALDAIARYVDSGGDSDDVTLAVVGELLPFKVKTTAKVQVI